MIRRTKHKPGDAIISGGKTYSINPDGTYVLYDRARNAVRKCAQQQRSGRPS